MKNPIYRFLSSVLLISLFLFTGCTAYRLPDPEPQSNPAEAYHVDPLQVVNCRPGQGPADISPGAVLLLGLIVERYDTVCSCDITAPEEVAYKGPSTVNFECGIFRGFLAPLYALGSNWYYWKFTPEIGARAMRGEYLSPEELEAFGRSPRY